MNLIDNKDGTVSDLDTDLMWQQATTSGVYIWDDAVKYCKNLILAGYLDWRLPTVEELRTIIKKGSSPVIIDMDYFPDTMASHYWTSTIYKCNSNYAWFVNFNSGYEYGNCKSYYNIRNNALQAVGNGVIACVKCGFSDIRALQIDHINGGGSKHKRSCSGSHEYYKTMIVYPEDYQLLCANCNQIKKCEDREHVLSMAK